MIEGTHFFPLNFSTIMIKNFLKNTTHQAIQRYIKKNYAFEGNNMNSMMNIFLESHLKT